jgi:hypothetical protein
MTFSNINEESSGKIVEKDNQRNSCCFIAVVCTICIKVGGLKIGAPGSKNLIDIENILSEI